MKLLFDIGHPAHVHLLKHTINGLKAKGYQIFITVKDLPVAKKLLKAEGLEFIEIGSKTDSIIGKAINQIKYNLKVLKLVRRNKIEIGIGTSITLPHVSRLSKMRSIVLDDDDDSVEPLFVKYGHPFANVILTPDSIKRKSKKSLYYAGIHELAYLHPNYFKPDIKVLEELGLDHNSSFFILRFVAFKGHHDVGQKGISFDQKKRLIELLKPLGKIFITSEKEIEPEFEEYRLPVAPEKIHSLMYYAKLFIGDSQTMTTEAAILGTMALKCNTFAGGLSVPNELEKKYGLCFSYQPVEFEKMFSHITELLKKPDLKKEMNDKRNLFLSEKISVTAFLIWFVENYPSSESIMRKNKDHQDQFK